jgi:16S rRNA (cytosine1402-N4)-methyltransferase
MIEMYKINHHISVLIDSILENYQLLFKKNTAPITLFDGTFGGGGYTEKCIEFFNSNGVKNFKIIASDLDINVKGFFEQISGQNESIFINSSFDVAIEQTQDDSLDLILLDLGFSTNQLHNKEMGLSYMLKDSVFDLRYNQYEGKSNLPAFQKIKKLKNDFELAKIIFRFSGEKNAKAISKNIFDICLKNDLVINDDITKAVYASLGFKDRKNLYSILSRVYQSIRIWVNDEFYSLENFMNIFPKKLKTGGVCSIVSFHSLEDKIVGKTFRTLSSPIVIDEYGNSISKFNLITKKAIKPSEEEIKTNPNSRSALLRIIQKN